jgi:hypothetical protein
VGGEAGVALEVGWWDWRKAAEHRALALKKSGRWWCPRAVIFKSSAVCTRIEKRLAVIFSVDTLAPSSTHGCEAGSGACLRSHQPVKSCCESNGCEQPRTWTSPIG